MHETSNANYLSPDFLLIDTIYYRTFRIKVANNRAKQTYTACPRVRPIRLWRVAACWLANGVGFTSDSLYFSYQTATFSQRQNLISYSRNERQLRDVEKISAFVRDMVYAKSLVYRVIRQISYWPSFKVSYCL